MEKLAQRSPWVERAAWLSLVISFVLLAVKFLAYSRTGSVAVLSDALESIVNVLTAIMAVVVLRQVAIPKDEEHPYGHGKLEYFSSAFEGGLISFAALAVAYEAAFAIFEKRHPTAVDTGMLLMGIAAGINLVLGIFLLMIAKKNKSEALAASGIHLLSDVATSIGVLAGLVLVYLTDIGWIDSAVALIVAVYLAWTGIRVARSSAGALIDEMDPGTMKQLLAALISARRPEVIDIHNLKLIRSGSFHHVDAHVVMPEFLSVMDSHRLSMECEGKVKEFYPYDLEIAFHVDPCQQNYCRQCDYTDCSIRKQPFEGQKTWLIEDLIRGPSHKEAPK